MHPGVMCNVQQVLRLFCLSDFVFVVPSEQCFEQNSSDCVPVHCA
jgi:hypothetical protein